MSRHILVGVLVLSIAAGTAAVIVLAAAHRASKDKALGLFALFTACLLFMALRTVAVDYLSLNTRSGLSGGAVLLFFYAPMPVTALLIGILPLLAHKLVGSPLGRAARVAAFGAPLILGAVMLSPLYGAYDGARRSIGFGTCFYPVNAALLCMAVYAVALVARRLGRVRAGLAPLVGKALVAFALFLPALALDLFFSPAENIPGAMPFLKGFFPIFLIAISIGSIAYALGYLLGLARKTRQAGEDEARSLAERLSSRLEELARERGLSAREREVALMALRGASNKEIAHDLLISKRTADNHLYNLYRKLGIESRYELVSLLSSSPGT